MLLEIFNNLFMSVAEQMGARLRATAHSVNIKERLDFSCAVFDAPGGLIANAPHMPVHLGSMGESIAMVAARNAGTMRPGDVYMLNDPYHGGTHLPDVTVVTPVFGEAGARPAVLRRVAGAPRRDRRDHARVDARVQHRGERGRGGDRQLAAGAGRGAARGGDQAPAGRRALPVAQPRGEPGRPARADRRQRARGVRVAADGAAFRPGRGARLHGARAGQRRGGGAPGDRRAARRRSAGTRPTAAR